MTPNPFNTANANLVSTVPAAANNAVVSVSTSQSINELIINLTVGATNVNSGNNILVIPGRSRYYNTTLLGGAVPDQQAAGIVLDSTISAGSANGYIDFTSLVNNSNLKIAYINITTNDTSIYDKRLFFGTISPNGQKNQSYWRLDSYAKSNSSSNGWQRALTIDTMPGGRDQMALSVSSNFYLMFEKIATSSTVTIALGLIGDGQTVITAQ